jgi:hypothetical protein
MTILKSASKIVFLLMAIGALVFTYFKIITGEQFLILASMAFSFYFANKGNTNEPYAGK